MKTKPPEHSANVSFIIGLAYVYIKDTSLLNELQVGKIPIFIQEFGPHKQWYTGQIILNKY